MRDMKRFLLFLCVLALPAPAAAATAPDESWKDYVNVRFGFAICYPEGLLIPQGEADNADGQSFKAEDGAELSAFGTNNALGRSLRQEASERARRYAGSKGRITYHLAEPERNIVSGDDGASSFFYAKTLARDDQFVTFRLKYPKAAAARYKPVVERLSQCFRLTDGAA